MECPVQCGRNAHAAPGFFLWQELPLKHPKRMRSPMPQAAFYGDWGISPTKQKIAFVSRKPCLQKSGSKLTLFADKSIILTGLLCKNLAN